MKRRERERWEACVDREVTWFYGTLGARVPETGARRKRALVIEAALRAALPFHRGVLSLWHTEKVWPADLRKQFGECTSVAVRLECAHHASVGSTASLEAAAVERLFVQIARGTKEDKIALERLALRAGDHYRQAIRALGKVRASLAKTPLDLPPDAAPVSGAVPAGETLAKESA